MADVYRVNESKQPCWQCAKACGGCSWSLNFTPIDGWGAEAMTDKYGELTYKIVYCPEFVHENRENRERPEFTTDGCIALVKKCLEVARDDYLHSGERGQEMIRKFIRGRGASRLHMIADPEGVIKRLNEDAIAYKKRRAMRLMVK